MYLEEIYTMDEEHVVEPEGNIIRNGFKLVKDVC